MEQNGSFYLWDVYAPDLLVRIHNSPGIWALQPSLDTEHWTVGSRKQISHLMPPAEEQHHHWTLVLPFQPRGHLNNTEERFNPKNQTGSFPSTVRGEMLHSPILWPIMENLSHCSAEGANFTDHQPASQSDHTSRARFDLEWMKSPLCLRGRKTAPQNLCLAGIIYINT